MSLGILICILQPPIAIRAGACCARRIVDNGIYRTTCPTGGTNLLASSSQNSLHRIRIIKEKGKMREYLSSWLVHVTLKVGTWQDRTTSYPLRHLRIGTVFRALGTFFQPIISVCCLGKVFVDTQLLARLLIPTVINCIFLGPSFPGFFLQCFVDVVPAPSIKKRTAVASLHPCDWGFWIPAVRALAGTGASTFEAKIMGLSSWGGALRILAFPFWAELARNIEHRIRIHHGLSLSVSLSHSPTLHSSVRYSIKICAHRNRSVYPPTPCLAFLLIHSNKQVTVSTESNHTLRGAPKQDLQARHGTERHGMC